MNENANMIEQSRAEQSRAEQSNSCVLSHNTPVWQASSVLPTVKKAARRAVGKLLFNTPTRKLLSRFAPTLMTRLLYYAAFNERLDLKHPRGINQKLHYLKLNDYYNNPIITQCVDKFRVREYLAGKGYGGLSAPLLSGLYEDANKLLDIWDGLPEKFVLKCNHGCGFNILVEDKGKESPQALAKQLARWLKEDLWTLYCEPQYKFVKKGFFAEEHLGRDIHTYKFYCFNGEPKVLYVSATGENGEHDLYLDYYDMDWKWLPFSLAGHQHMKTLSAPPETFEDMKRISRDLAKDFPFVRVDLYGVGDKTFFSELTFIPTGGFMNLQPREVIDEWGSWLELPLRTD